jgi:hypothetical protein
MYCRSQVNIIHKTIYPTISNHEISDYSINTQYLFFCAQDSISWSVCQFLDLRATGFQGQVALSSTEMHACPRVM